MEEKKEIDLSLEFLELEKRKEAREKKKIIIQIIFLILLVIAIAVMLFAILTIYKYRDMLKNPVGYNMDKFGLNFCSCYDKNNKIVSIPGLHYNDSYEKFMIKPKYNETQYNTSELNNIEFVK